MTTPLRIGIAVHTFPVLTETFVLEPIVDLVRRGHDVEILALYPGDPAATHPAVREHGLRERTTFLIGTRPGRAPLRKAWTGGRRLLRPGAWRLPWRRMLADVAQRSMVRMAPELLLAAVGATTQRSPQPLTYDVIHAHMGRVGLVMQYLRDWGVVSGPLVTTFHGSDVMVHPRRHGPGVYDRLFAGAELLTANTRFLRGELLAMGAPESKTEVVPVGVDLSPFELRPRRPPSGRPVKLLTVARLDPLKGLRYGIEAVQLLRQAGIEATYTIVGEGPQRSELEALVRSLGLEDAVHLTGGLTWESIPAIYADHDIFLLPGVIQSSGAREAQGRVLIEAQASGMPVVATEVGGIPEAVAPGAGRLVPERDAGALAAAIRELLEAPDEWEAMGRRGREYVERQFDNRRILTEMEERYRELADARRSP